MTKRCIHCLSEMEDDMTICPDCHRDQIVNTPDHQIHPGFILAKRYEILQAIYEDAFSITYRAYDLEGLSEVWITEFFPKAFAARSQKGKERVLINPEHQEDFDKYLEEFISTYTALAKDPRLTNMPEILALFKFNHTVYAVYKPLEGLPLPQWISMNGVMPFEQAVDFFRPVFKDLYLLNRKQVFHTLIRPENIYIGPFEARLGGFSVNADYDLYQSDEANSLFDNGYRAMEQIRESASNGSWTDVYGMGAVLYKTVSGKDPKQIRSQPEYEAFVREDLSQNVNPDLRYVLGKSLSPKAVDRYANSAAFFQALEDLSTLRIDEKKDEITRSQMQPVVNTQNINKTSKIKVENETEKAITPVKKVRKNKSRKVHIIQIAGTILIVVGIAAAGINTYFWLNNKSAENTKQGVYENGYLSDSLLEELQNVNEDTLVLKNCNFSKLSADKLTENPIVTSITIENPQELKSLDFLAKFPSVTKLVLYDCNIDDSMTKSIDWSTFYKLKDLKISNNFITNLDFLSSCSELENLNASGNRLDSMSGIAALPNLAKANLSNNHIQTFTALQSGKDVVLDLSSNAITKVEVAEGQPSAYYTFLALDENPLFDGAYEDYSGLDLLAGNVLAVNYEYNENHLDENQTELAAYCLAYTQFDNVWLIDMDDETSQETIQSYFAFKPYEEHSSEDVRSLMTELLK